ncbi:MAG: glycoside hydrolase family 43 protein [Bacteroidota bacterium]|nr:glycoside hydrolase family 43 protein [Bacteroidota bacterium]
MRILFLTICFLSLHCISHAQQNSGNIFLFCYFKNNGQDGLHLAYSRDGYTFKALHKDSSFLQPTVSKDKLMRDPCIIRGADGLFHMVWTVSWNAKGIGYASSADLIHWSEQQYLPVMEQEDSARNAWAPEITYDAANKEYMIYWATTIAGKYGATDRSVENGYNHRIYYVTTKDFKSFSTTHLLYDKGFNVIDATIVPGNNRFIMFLKDETLKPVPQKNIHIAMAAQLTGPYSDPSPAITGHYWAEGPTALRMDRLWIVFFDKYREHTYGAVSSTDLVNWIDISDRISLPKGIRHGSVFMITAKEFEALRGSDE